MGFNNDILKKMDVLVSEIENSELELDVKIALLKTISNKALAAEIQTIVKDW